MYAKLERLLSKSLTTLEVMAYFLVVHTGPGQLTYAEIQDITNISSGSLTRIFHNCLGVRKRCARWVTHSLSEEQKRGRVHWRTHMRRKFDGGRSPRVWDMSTGDETWVYHYDPETKQQSAVWVFPDENPPVKFKRNKSASKQMINAFLCKIRPRCYHTALG